MDDGRDQGQDHADSPRFGAWSSTALRRFAPHALSVAPAMRVRWNGDDRMPLANAIANGKRHNANGFGLGT
jgi:hypothetical protein